MNGARDDSLCIQSFYQDGQAPLGDMNRMVLAESRPIPSSRQNMSICDSSLIYA